MRTAFLWSICLTILLTACSSTGSRRRSSSDDLPSSDTEVDLALPPDADELHVDLQAPPDLGVPADFAIGSAVDASSIDLASASADLTVAPADLFKPADLLASDLQKTPWPTVSECFPTSWTVYPDRDVTGSCKVTPATGAPAIAKVELVDHQNRLYGTLTSATPKWNFKISWAIINAGAAQKIDFSVTGQYWLALRITDVNGTVFVIELPQAFLVRCLNGVNACNGACGDCAGPTYAACLPATSTDSCDTLCAKSGRVCATGCASTMRYIKDACDSTWVTTATMFVSNTRACDAPFGASLTHLGKTLPIWEAGISCCCE